MLVRIRFQSGPRVSLGGRKNRHVALALATLLTPLAITVLALAIWSLAADLRVAGAFAIRQGFFSHWIVWLGIALLVQAAGIGLNRYGTNEPLLKTLLPKQTATLAD